MRVSWRFLLVGAVAFSGLGLFSLRNSRWTSLSQSSVDAAKPEAELATTSAVRGISYQHDMETSTGVAKMVRHFQDKGRIGGNSS